MMVLSVNNKSKVSKSIRSQEERKREWKDTKGFIRHVHSSSYSYLESTDVLTAKDKHQCVTPMVQKLLRIREIYLSEKAANVVWQSLTNSKVSWSLKSSHLFQKTVRKLLTTKMNKFTIIFVLMGCVCLGHCQIRPIWRQPPRQIWPGSSISFMNNNNIDDYVEPVDNSWRDDVDEFSGPQRGVEFSNPEGWQNGGIFNDRDRNQRQRTTVRPRIEPTSTQGTIHASPEDCPCQFTPQFNPVCGTDGNTYRNIGLLNCYRQCGFNVSQKRMGTC